MFQSIYLSLDYDRHEVNGKYVSPRVWALACAFQSKAFRSKEDLQIALRIDREARGHAPATNEDVTLWVAVRELKRALKGSDCYIKAVYGEGYEIVSAPISLPSSVLLKDQNNGHDSDCSRPSPSRTMGTSGFVSQDKPRPSVLCKNRT